MRMRTVIVASLLLGRMSSAQGTPHAQLEGVVTDSVRGKPLEGAWVNLMRRDVESLTLLRSVTDSRGRYRFDSLAAGRYTVGFGSEALDSLDVMLPERDLTLTAGQRARMDFATPSGTTLRAAACPGLSLANDRGAIVGLVTDADDERPIAKASIVVSWQDIVVDRATLNATTQQRTGVVETDSLGRYRLCGVPTESWVVIQIQGEGRAGAAVRLSVPGDVGVVQQPLSMSKSGSRLIAALDSMRADTTPPLLRGSSELAGVVRSATGPLAAAQVRVVETGSVTLTDSLGRYTLRDLPAGTQILEVRRIGYLVRQIPVQLRSATPTHQIVQLVRIVNLDSVRVVAQRVRYREFEQNRRSMGGFGTHLRQEDIERRNPSEMSDVIRMMTGFRVIGSGIGATVISSRGAMSLSNAECVTNIVIDGMQHQEINIVSPSDVGAIEAYPGQTAPAFYGSVCGTIMIWTKR